MVKADIIIVGLQVGLADDSLLGSGSFKGTAHLVCNHLILLNAV